MAVLTKVVYKPNYSTKSYRFNMDKKSRICEKSILTSFKYEEIKPNRTTEDREETSAE